MSMPLLARQALGRIASLARSPALRAALLAAAFVATVVPARSATALADQPLFTVLDVPGNLILALSVEYPTAVSVANLYDYDAAKDYLGYFDPKKCYDYDTTTVIADTPTTGFFKPAAMTTNHTCSGRWSGNFLNWATMQTIDPYRWALTGGYRAVDTATDTILKKAWASGQGGLSIFPNRGTNQASGHQLNVAPSTVTPFNWTRFNLSVAGQGTNMMFTGTADFSGGLPTWDGVVSTTNVAKTYLLNVRVRVCDKGFGVANLESNCTAYGTNYKPEGLMQKNASKIRYSAFGYLNDSTMNRDGGVMRARMNFIGPTKPVPGSSAVTNTAAEWSSVDGTFIVNPDAADATATTAATVTTSGVMNYLNGFGQKSGTYKGYDPVSELYYSALRYYKNLGNVPEYTNGLNAAMVDNFPVITSWDDPIIYSCQKNFILGIGDVNTHGDGNVPGSTISSYNPAMESAVSADTSVNATTATNKIGQLETGRSGLGSSTTPCCSAGTYYIAGLAYDAHTKDMRPDLSGTQTAATYWLDVMEGQTYKSKNQYWYAAKYGGFSVPTNYDTYGNTTPLDDALWYTSTDTIGSDKRPDNYFTAARADLMVDGLTKAFKSIVSNLKLYTTSFSTASPVVTSAGSVSFSALYDASNWSGEVVGSALSFDNSGLPTLTEKWKFSTKLATQLAGTGWNDSRRVATWNTGTSQGVPFRYTNLSTAQQSALDTAYRSGNDASDYLDYLRGNPLHEQGSTATGSSKAYRTRTGPMGDIVGSKVRAVGAPASELSNAANPGYGSFKTTWATRPTVAYVGANDGMLHAIKGTTTGADAGTELFAYVPGMTFQGPTGAPGTTGLAALGNPDFSHHYYVNATPTIFDVDFSKTVGGSGDPGWKTVLIGGMGKGGKGYYALDVTDPVGMSASETALASKVLWEFTDADMGYSYGDPIVVKTRQYGWVAVLTSGYNNADGKGYFFIVNPRTGALLQKVATGTGSTTTPAGLTQVTGFINNAREGTADALYAGDLLGNLWRVDISGSSGSFPVVKIGALTDTTGTPQVVTTKPVIAGQPGTLKRFVMVGTGKLLDTSDIASAQTQTFYAIVDGKESRFRADGDLPTSIRFPIGRSKLAQITDTTIVTGVSYNETTQIGWYYDLGIGNGSIGWRVTTDPSAGAGQVLFSTTLPNGQVCSPSGSSRLYAIDFGAGRTSFTSNAPYVASDSLMTDFRIYRYVPTETNNNNNNNNGGSQVAQNEVVRCTNQGECNKDEVRPAGTGLGVKRLNWRELPLAD